ncbi:hypothetical protein [Capnocytophaga felis]|uniref:Uncharacterized protein n=1 Tax=Capnocytophaga felis TaxID=2267611 RepID=A0A5M4B742_9FLAO|nr:hypothetical protein [Capnocytophaga felis]GET45423.1 hypothetical protein RCZ01_07250 [Capnocytophaga felis]GET47414.1 hypothetical protein RCZ02_02450 [Capnocytophaga felis]
MKEYNYLDFTFHCTVIFFAHKRKYVPNLNSGKYRPHFMVKGQKDYLGIYFIDGEEVVFDKPIKCSALPLYDTVDYSALTEGTSFFIMESSNIVGEGIVEKIFWHR